MIASLIPQPKSFQPTDTGFEITAGTVIAAPADPEAARVADYLADSLREPTGFELPIAEDRADAGAIRLELDAAAFPDEPEAYGIDVDASGVRLRAGTAEGLFRAVQTLRQLLPAAIESRSAFPADTATSSDATDSPTKWLVPGVAITDAPRYAYRSAMLDVARHFFPVAEVKSFLDLLAAYKLNRLHLHLSDDQGWRIEIPSRPALTEKASGYEVGNGPGGFYTVADYAEIVAYAAERFITIVPEIDVPGHATAAVLAYPEIGPDWFTPTPYTETGVGFSALAHDREATYAFLADVFQDLAAMTPGPYLHIGCDEVDKLTSDEFGLFVRRAAEIAAATGKTVIGWEEIVTAGVPNDVIAQYWDRSTGGAAADGIGDEPFRQAMRAGTKAVVSPASRSYLDMMYDAETAIGQDWAGLTSVRKAYEWDPATFLGDVPAENVLGIEAALWTETVRSIADAEYLTLPRLPGLAEIAWSPAGRDWDEFRVRLAAHAERWTAQGRAYFRAPEVWE